MTTEFAEEIIVETMKAHTSKIIGEPHETWKQWHRAVQANFEGRNDEAAQILDKIFADDIVFKPPTYFKSRKGKPFAIMALKGITKLFKDFEYTREFVGPEDMALEFLAKCGTDGPVVQGVDLIKLNSKGQITEFAVVGRPPNAIQIMLEHQSKELEGFLKQSKL